MLKNAPTKDSHVSLLEMISQNKFKDANLFLEGDSFQVETLQDALRLSESKLHALEKFLDDEFDKINADNVDKQDEILKECNTSIRQCTDLVDHLDMILGRSPGVTSLYDEFQSRRNLSSRSSPPNALQEDKEEHGATFKA